MWSVLLSTNWYTSSQWSECCDSQVRNKFWPLWWRVSLLIRVQIMLNHIWFVFYHNIKDNERNLCQDLLTIGNTNLDLKVSALHYGIMQMRYMFVSDFPFKNFCKLAQHAETNTKKVWEKSNDTYSLSIRVQTTINHISDLLFITISVLKKLFLSGRERKKVLHDTLMQAAWYWLLSTMANWPIRLRDYQQLWLNTFLITVMSWSSLEPLILLDLLF